MPQKVLLSPIFAIMRYSGITRTDAGIIMVPKKSQKITSRPGNSIRANA